MQNVKLKTIKTHFFEICNLQFPVFNSHKTGFTLIELIIVISIISVITAIIMPSFWHSGEQSLKLEAKRLGNTLRFIYDEAVGKKETYLIKINLDSDSWSYESEKESRNFTMEKNVMFKNIVIPSLGEVSRGEVTLIFSPLGPEEPITIHLLKDEFEYTVTFNHLNGRAKIHEGYPL